MSIPPFGAAPTPDATTLVKGKVQLAGDLTGTAALPTIKSSVALSGNPTTTTQSAGDSSNKIATDAFVTGAINTAIAGVNPAVAVQAATTAASDTSGLTYNNGASGIGATLTGLPNTALTVDGYTFTALGQRLLVKNDTQSPSGAFDGVYYVTQLQTAILPLILTRTLDYDMPSDVNNTGAIPVTSGTVNGITSWVLTSQVTTIGTDPLTYTRFSINPSTLLTNGLTSAHIFVGNVSNVATDTAVTGDVSISNAGVVTLPTVNTNTGAWGSATQVATFTVNGKGLTTAAGNTAIQIAESQVTSLVSDLAGKQSAFDIALSLKSPTVNETITAGYSGYIANEYEIQLNKETEIALGATLEIG